MGKGVVNIQPPIIVGGASTIVRDNLTASRVLVSDSNGKVGVSSITTTKLGYLSDVTGDIQSQLNGKVSVQSGKGLSTNDFTNDYKNKLEGIEPNANKYSLPVATSNALGGVRIGYTTSGKNYPVQLDSNNKMYVNVPWGYSDATTSVSGLMSSTDKAKLDGISAGAEVNVQADWNETSTSSDAYIKNKPLLKTISVYLPEFYFSSGGTADSSMGLTTYIDTSTGTWQGYKPMALLGWTYGISPTYGSAKNTSHLLIYNLTLDDTRTDMKIELKLNLRNTYAGEAYGRPLLRFLAVPKALFE